MDILIVILCGLFSCVKVTVQGRLARLSIKNTYDSILVNCFIFAFTAIMFSVSALKGINLNVIPYAVFFGVFSALFQICYALSLKTGPFSMSCMLINLNMILPAVFSIVVFDEKLTITKFTGFLLCLLAMILINTGKDDKKTSIKWFVYVMLAFLSTASVSIVQKIYGKSAHAGDLPQFIFLGYFIAFLVTLILVSILKMQKQEANFKLSKPNLLLVLVIVVCLGTFQYLYTLANTFVDVIVLTPSVSGLSTIFLMLSGRIIFKEKFTPKQLWAICIGLAAIVLISI